MADVAGNSIITPRAAGALVEPGDPATRVVKGVASLVALQIEAPARPDCEIPAASRPLVSPDRAG